MIEHVVIVALAGVLWGWLWCSPAAHLLDPVRGRIKAWIIGVSWPDEAELEIDVWGWRLWVMHRLGCPICMGFDATVAAHLCLTGWLGWDSIAILAAANGAHVAWMTWLQNGDRDVEVA